MLELRFHRSDASLETIKRIVAAASGIALTLGALLPSRALRAADVWGGSLGTTSDYLVRGITRSNNDWALQGDLHFATDAGFLAGLFASSTQLTPYDRRDAEVGALIGYAWQPGNAWRAKLAGSYYSYPWNDSGSQYNYAELLAEATFDDWLSMQVAYSPRARYLPDASLAGESATSGEINLRTPWRRRLALSAGIGRTEFSGPAGGYTYWSASAMADLAPWLLTVGYVDTNAAAKTLFYSAAAHDQWVATVIWRF